VSILSNGLSILRSTARLGGALHVSLVEEAGEEYSEGEQVEQVQVDRKGFTRSVDAVDLGPLGAPLGLVGRACGDSVLGDLRHPFLDVLRNRLVVVGDTNTLGNALFAGRTEQELLDQSTNGRRGRRLNNLRNLRGSRGNSRSGAGGDRRDGGKNLVRSGDRDIVLNEQVDCSVACTPDELCNLDGGEGTLDALGNPDIKSRESEVGVLFQSLAFLLNRYKRIGKSYHQCVDEAVDEDEHPDGRAHVAHTSPHAQHSACVVVCLQSCAALALCDNDKGVQDLVELAEVEDPTPKGQSFVPQSSNVGRVRVTVRSHVDERVLGLPDVNGGVVCCSITKTSGSVDLAHRVGDTCKAVWVVETGPGVLEGSEHGDEGSEAVDGEYHIVEDNEGLEEGLACDPPRLVVTLTVHSVEGKDGENVGGSEEEWHLRAHREVEQPWRDAKRRAKGALFDRRR
jgi:hypothetical protein